MLIGASATAAVGASVYIWQQQESGRPTDDVPASPPPIRIGWQTAWSQQGQVIQALLHSNAQELVQFKLTLTGFLFGPDLNEAAIAQSIDVTNAGIVPVVNLIAASPKWTIVGRQVDFDISVVASQASKIKKPNDLRGKRFGVPIGGGSHPYAIDLVRKEGIPEGTGANSVEIINVSPSDMLLALRAGQVDAVACWDPVTTLALTEGHHLVVSTRYGGFITAPSLLIRNRREQLVRLLAGYGLAYKLARENKDRVDRLYAESAKLKLDLVQKLPVTDRDLVASARGLPVISPQLETIQLTQSVADTMLDLGLIKKKISITDRVDTTLSGEASALMASLVPRIKLL
ncbi:ABC transporter substrate-binding protein [Methylocystis sp. H62]|uniref:ABC transporter substrate-binding protein n=1 Tax=Methylocystis sp. H62 TaxID=2785789 RepID=UPI0018C30F7C|nr:ABC transporter substrate-binding protein [Methylocystis sp. H62]MBG0794466.1 ABC transporter substrate-binding protein [Methylocystis sp. H62]